jgi:hypothetical protein
VHFLSFSAFNFSKGAIGPNKDAGSGLVELWGCCLDVVLRHYWSLVGPQGGHTSPSVQGRLGGIFFLYAPQKRKCKDFIFFIWKHLNILFCLRTKSLLFWILLFKFLFGMSTRNNNSYFNTIELIGMSTI